MIELYRIAKDKDVKLKMLLKELQQKKSVTEGKEITQKEISAGTGLPESTVSRYMRGYVNNFNDEVIAKFAMYFEVTDMNEIFTLSD